MLAGLPQPAEIERIMHRQLFELTTADGCSISPYVWRTKFALARKGLAYRSEPVGFNEIGTIGPGVFATVPVLHDGGEWIGDSWQIADYLDRAYPQQSLFQSAAERATVRFFDRWLAVEVVVHLFRICALDIHHRLREADQPYFRASREQRLGRSLEAAHQERDRYLPVLRQRLQPLRLLLREQRFVGGEEAGYADFIAAGAMIWAGSIATVPLLSDDDELLGWLSRCLGLYAGVGAHLALPAFPSLLPAQISEE